MSAGALLAVRRPAEHEPKRKMRAQKATASSPSLAPAPSPSISDIASPLNVSFEIGEEAKALGASQVVVVPYVAAFVLVVLILAVLMLPIIALLAMIRAVANEVKKITAFVSGIFDLKDAESREEGTS